MSCFFGGERNVAVFSPKKKERRREYEEEDEEKSHNEPANTRLWRIYIIIITIYLLIFIYIYINDVPGGSA